MPPEWGINPKSTSDTLMDMEWKLTRYPIRYDGSCLPLKSERRNAAGLTLLEVLLVVAILAVVLGIGVFNGRQAVTAQGELAAINSLQQTVWQGATAASARGQIVTMRMEGHDLVLRVGDDGEGQVLRRESFPADVITNMPQGNVLLFTPPGKVEINSLSEAQDYYLGTSKGQSFFEISVIGEVRVR